MRDPLFLWWIGIVCYRVGWSVGSRKLGVGLVWLGFVHWSRRDGFRYRGYSELSMIFCIRAGQWLALLLSLRLAIIELIPSIGFLSILKTLISHLFLFKSLCLGFLYNFKLILIDSMILLDSSSLRYHLILLMYHLYHNIIFENSFSSSLSWHEHNTYILLFLPWPFCIPFYHYPLYQLPSPQYI